MTAPTNPPAQPDPGEDCAAATSVGGLARDLEACGAHSVTWQPNASQLCDG